MNKVTKRAHAHKRIHEKKKKKKKMQERKWWLPAAVQGFNFTETVFHHQCLIFDFQNSHYKTN